MGKANTPQRRGGIHHIAIRASNFDASLRFYCAGLGCEPTLLFFEDGLRVALLDTGDGTYIELFEGAAGDSGAEVLLHVALRTPDCAAAAAQARAAGAAITIEPTDVMLEGNRRVPLRYAFCTGLDGEVIELLQSDQL